MSKEFNFDGSFDDAYGMSRGDYGRYIDYVSRSEIPEQRMLILPHVPGLIGGASSNQFIIQTDGHPDTPPDPENILDAAEIIVPAQNWTDLIDTFAARESQADHQYLDALFETQQLLAEAEERGLYT
ncbi:MAG TPA: hypothetical protein VJP80_03990 [Candidatus Saccharimonadales bacterium]|nr:hypothetical protein [Candidatus Saccharimonadales bacterium]